MKLNNLKILDEPKLEFSNRQLLEHPRDGLTLFGPYDSKGIRTPRHTRYGIVGTPNGIASAKAFMAVLSRPVLTEEKLDSVLWPHFPGFEESFHAILPVEPAREECLDQAQLEQLVRQADQHSRAFSIADVFMNAIRRAKRTDDVCDVFLCVVPDIVWKNCRPESRVAEALGKSLSNKQVELRRHMDDMFGGYTSDQYEYSVDFRRQIKARVMELDVPIQIVRESTLTLTPPEFGQRQLTTLSDRAWNLSTAIYYKSGGKPWKLSGARDGVCYVGVAFKNTEDGGQNACCAAQMFLDDGDGVVFLGDEGQWRGKKKGEYHLSKESARRLLAGILQTYDEQHGKPLKEIFLHSRSSLNDEELSGYLDACPPGGSV